jgi:hypothetical protein
MSQTATADRLNRLGGTLRPDAWWIEILPTIIVFSGFVIYTTWRAFQGKFYEWGPYLSSFYSPLIDPEHHWWPFPPALLILAGPAGFRFTCYYYRKAYYRAFVMHPPSCAVSEGRGGNYLGEIAFPLVLQNVHRYFFYVAVIFIGFLWYDAIVAFDSNGKFGIGVGSLVMAADIILLSMYTFGCHAFRHLAGGRLDCFSCSRSSALQHSAWRGISVLNEHHMFWAWMSLFSVALTDLYIYLVAAHILRDIRIL